MYSISPSLYLFTYQKGPLQQHMHNGNVKYGPNSQNNQLNPLGYQITSLWTHLLLKSDSNYVVQKTQQRKRERPNIHIKGIRCALSKTLWSCYKNEPIGTSYCVHPKLPPPRLEQSHRASCSPDSGHPLQESFCGRKGIAETHTDMEENLSLLNPVPQSIWGMMMGTMI